MAQHVATELGITSYEAEVLPPRKVEAVKALQARGYRVAFIGDGINDSPALAHADIGLAVKGGADVAQETAHVVLFNGDPHGISTAITLAREAVQLDSGELEYHCCAEHGRSPAGLFSDIGPCGSHAAQQWIGDRGDGQFPPSVVDQRNSCSQQR